MHRPAGAALLGTTALLLATALAGCVQDPALAPADDARSMTPAPPPSYPVDWSGRLAAGVWVCQFAVGWMCRGHSPDPAASDVEYTIPDLGGLVTGGVLTLEWSPASDLMHDLRFGIMLHEGTALVAETEAAGASPLVIDLATIAADAGSLLHVWVWPPSWAPSPLSVVVVDDQSFRVHGHVTTTPDVV